MSRRRILFPELFMPLVWAIYWWPVISGQAWLYIRDLTLFALPMKYFLLERFGAGDLPLWTPHVAAGMPFLADPANQTLYPANILFWLLPSLQQSLSWFQILHHLLAMFAFSWLCRAQGLGRMLSVWAGIVYALAGYSLSISDNVNFLPALAWAPAALAAFVHGLTRTRYTYAVPCALSLACIVLAGDPLNAVIVVALWGLLAGQGMATQFSAGLSLLNTASGFAVRLLLLSVGLAILVTAAQVLPALELATVSIRHHGLPYEEIGKWSFPLRRLMELVQPYFFAANYPTLDFLAADSYPSMHEPWANSVYLGSLTVVLAGVGIITSAKTRIPWLLMLAVALLMSFGANVPYHRALVENLPFFDSQRYPEKFMFWVTLISCYFAALGARALFSGSAIRLTVNTFQSPVMKITLSLAGIILSLWGLLYLPARAWIWEHAFEVFSIWGLRLPWAAGHFQNLALHTLIVCTIVVGWLWAPAVRRNNVLVAALILCAADLFWIHYRFVPLMPVALAESVQPPYALQFLNQKLLSQQNKANHYRIYYDVYTPKSDVNYIPGDLQQRIVAGLEHQGKPFEQGYVHLYADLFRRDRLQVNSAIRHGLDYLNGRMSPLQPALTLAFEEQLLQRDPNKLMTLAGVRYVISALVPHNRAWDGDGFVTVHEDSARNLRIVENMRRLPMALVVGQGYQSGASLTDRLKAIEAITDPWQSLVLSGADSGLSPTLPCAGHQQHDLSITRPKPEQILLAGNLTCAGAYLLLNETYSRGWTASLNGSATEIRPANLRFMAVALPPGPFKVEFSYRENSLLMGVLLSSLGLCLCLGIGIGAWRRTGIK